MGPQRTKSNKTTGFWILFFYTDPIGDRNTDHEEFKFSLTILWDLSGPSACRWSRDHDSNVSTTDDSSAVGVTGFKSVMN